MEAFFRVKRSGLHNRFELENLEPRILLSADAALASLPGVLPDELESDPDTGLLPQIDEVAIGAEDRLEDNPYQNQTAYDPSQSIDDIFAGLSEENLVDATEDENEHEDDFKDQVELEVAIEEAFDHANGFEDEDEHEDEYDQLSPLVYLRHILDETEYLISER